MNLLSKILILVMALGLAACKNPNRFGADGANGANAGGIGANGLGDPSIRIRPPISIRQLAIASCLLSISRRFQIKVG